MKLYLDTTANSNNFDMDGISEQANIDYIADALLPHLIQNGISYTRDNNSRSDNKPSVQEFGIADADVILSFNCERQNFDNGGAIFFNSGAASLSELLCEKISSQCLGLKVLTAQSMESEEHLTPKITISASFAAVKGANEQFKNNIHNIARATGEALAEYQGKRFIPPEAAEGVPASQFMFSGRTYGEIVMPAADIKTEPAQNAPIMTRLKKGAQVLVLSGNNRGYVEVRYNDRQGFIAADSLNVFIISSNTKARLGSVNSNVNIRLQPSINAGVAGIASAGSDIMIIKSEGLFYEVNYKGLAGYAIKSEIDV